MQSGNWSGPVGSTQGQQPFRDGLVVREQQPESRGFVPLYGRIEVECRATLGPRSMFSAWMIGVEDRPERCGEICLVEVFGNAIDGDTAAVGSGIHPFRDPALREEFSADRRVIDVREPHRYAVDWRPDGVDFLLDGEIVRRSSQSPDYPMLLIIGLFDFPDDGGAEPPPELVSTTCPSRRSTARGRSSASCSRTPAASRPSWVEAHRRCARRGQASARRSASSRTAQMRSESAASGANRSAAW